MLDGAVVEYDERKKFIRKIHVALECESSTKMTEFGKDFSKLLNVKADTKIYLHGLNHVTPAAADKLVTSRLGVARQLIDDCDRGPEWFVGFWPSPMKVNRYPSLWDAFGSPVDYAHLMKIRLYKFDGTKFEKVVEDFNAAPALAMISSAPGILAASPAS